MTWKVEQGDCLELLKALPDGCVDAVVTDPPYGVRKAEAWDGRDLFVSTVDEWMKEFVRVSRLGVIWFCAEKTISHVIKSSGDGFHRLLYWNKPPGSQYAGAANNRLWYSVEPIVVVVKSEDFTKTGVESKFGYSAFDARTVAKSKFGHPTTKPVELMEWLVSHYSDAGATILDPFCGSGTTGVACVQTGRNFIGFEIDAGYCEIARKRIAAAEAEIALTAGAA